MRNIKILDCTLRDGGYINNWDFDYNTSKSIITNLVNAGIDYIEIGFLSEYPIYEEKSVFNDIGQLNYVIDNNIDTNKLFIMIKPENFPCSNIPPAEYSKVKNIRLIFKKQQLDSALSYAISLIDKGYNVFINPTFCNRYTENEFSHLISKINDIVPCGFTIVDSIGSLNTDQTLQLYKLCDTLLNKNITLCFHFHNNMQLSFSNACALVNNNSDRELIIDTTIMGIGRGAGNLATELFTEYLNKYNGKKYIIFPILNMAQEYILPIYNKVHWGYSIPYFLSAKNGCHPNYAKYLSEIKELNYEKIDNMLKLISDDKKTNYDEKYISTLFFSMKK